MLEKLIRDHNLQLEGLTEQQFVDAIMQAIKAEDFTRLISPDGQSKVVYAPYRRVLALEARIAALEAQQNSAKPLWNGGGRFA